MDIVCICHIPDISFAKQNNEFSIIARFERSVSIIVHEVLEIFLH